MVPLPLLVERLVAVRASGRGRSLLELGCTSPLWVVRGGMCVALGNKQIAIPFAPFPSEHHLLILECQVSRITFGPRDAVASAARHHLSCHRHRELFLHLASHTSHATHVFFLSRSTQLRRPTPRDSKRASHTVLEALL